MNHSQVGRTLPLSVPRRLVCDLLHFARRVPSVPVQRVMRLADLARARSQAAHRISWCTLFVKAYGQVARRMPELRRAFVPFPYVRLYEHPSGVASVAVERLFGGGSPRCSSPGCAARSATRSSPWKTCSATTSETPSRGWAGTAGHCGSAVFPCLCGGCCGGLP